MDTLVNKETYVERKRKLVLDLGYGWIRLKSRTKKYLQTLKRQLIVMFLKP